MIMEYETYDKFWYVYDKNTPKLGVYLPKNWKDFGCIRDKINNKGRKIFDAYQDCKLTTLAPPRDIAECIERNVYQFQEYDPVQGKYVYPDLGQWALEHTYVCIADYIAAMNLPAPRRIQIEPGVFSPNPDEENCVKFEMISHKKNLYDAYKTCGCDDIYPVWDGADECLTRYIMDARGASLYEIYKSCRDEYKLKQATNPSLPPTLPPEPGSSKLFLFLGGLAALILLSKENEP